MEAELRAWLRHAGKSCVISGIFGLIAAWQTKDWRWIVGAISDLGEVALYIA